MHTHCNYSDRRFPGYDDAGKKLDAGVHRKYIFGQHVADYMNELADDQEAFEKQFSRMSTSHRLNANSRSIAEYLKNGIKAEDIEKIYKNAFAAIRKDPTHTAKPKKDVPHKRFGRKKFNLAQRKNRVAQKKAAYLKTLEQEE